MNQFITRAYNKITLNPEKGTITKISQENRLDDEIQYYKNIFDYSTNQYKNVSLYFPKIISCKREVKNYSLELEYFPFQNLAYYACSNHMVAPWQSIIGSLKYILSQMHGNNFLGDPKWKYSMYIEKIENEYNKLKNNFEWFKKFCSLETMEINGTKYDNFEIIWSKLKEFIDKSYCQSNEYTIFHGDLCFSNILIGLDKNENCTMRFVDPRGSFGASKDIYGDPYYDLAKLSHSTNGKYEMIIYDKFTLEYNEKSVNFRCYQSNFDKVHEIFTKELYSKYDQLKIKIIEGLIFVGMCARHYDSLERQIIMYSTGIKLLNECMSEIK